MGKISGIVKEKTHDREKTHENLKIKEVENLIKKYIQVEISLKEVPNFYRCDIKDVGRNRIRINIWTRTWDKEEIVDKKRIIHSYYVKLDKNKTSII